MLKGDIQYNIFLAPNIKVLLKALKLKWKIVEFILKKVFKNNHFSDVIKNKRCHEDCLMLINYCFSNKIWMFSEGYYTRKHRAQACSITIFKYAE